MKKQKALEDMSHLDLFEALIFDENIQDNLFVTNAFEPDEHGNNMIAMSFEGVNSTKTDGNKAMMLFTFNKSGRLVGMEVATLDKSKKKWYITKSETFVDMKPRWVGVTNTKDSN